MAVPIYHFPRMGRIDLAHLRPFRLVGPLPGWASIGSRRDHHEITFQLGAFVGAAAQEGIAGSDGGYMHLVNYVDAALEHCAVCRSFDKAPHARLAGISTISTFNGKLRGDLSPWGDIMLYGELHSMDLYSEYPIPIPARSKNPREVRGALCIAWIGVSGQTEGIRTDEGDAWGNEILRGPLSESRIKLHFQAAGAHSWIPERRNGLARGIHNPLPGDSRSAGEQVLPEVQWYSAYRMVFGSDPVDIFGRVDRDADSLFAQETTLSGQFTQQWRLRMVAQEAAPEGVANSKLRPPSAYNKSFNCADIAIADSAPFQKRVNRKSAPRRRGTAKILDIDETGVTVKFQSPARYGERRKG